MKFSRALIVFIILVMASSQALAAVCSISCAGLGGDAHQSILTTEMPEMDMADCHDTNSNQDQQASTHLNCSMMGCHFSQLVVFDIDVKGLVPALANSALPLFISTATSADQPPPIKPPA